LFNRWQHQKPDVVNTTLHKRVKQGLKAD